jgi:large subunit ribosomal protein L40
MATSHASIRQLVSPLLQSFRNLSLSPSATTPNVIPKSLSSSTRTFSSSPSLYARKSDKKKQGDPRVTLIRYHMQHPETPRPLRLSRMRALRHWTIHRAWMLARRKKLEGEEVELHRFVLPLLSPQKKINSLLVLPRSHCPMVQTEVEEKGREILWGKLC